MAVFGYSRIVLVREGGVCPPRVRRNTHITPNGATNAILKFSKSIQLVKFEPCISKATLHLESLVQSCIPVSKYFEVRINLV